jgi:hypothetical protein
MSDYSILGVAQTAMQTGLRGLKSNALAIAGLNTSNETLPAGGSLANKNSLENELTDMKSNTYQVLASGKVVESADKMLGSLLDEIV